MPHSSVAEDSYLPGYDTCCDTGWVAADIQKECTTFMFKAQAGKGFLLVDEWFPVFWTSAGNHSLNNKVKSQKN
jgi:hypothetical protein